MFVIIMENIVSYELIHCSEHTEREEYINNLKKSFGIEINKGVCTTKTEIRDNKEYLKINYPEMNLYTSFWQRGQLGCYLSHYNIIKKIMNEKTDGYTVIFEDDVIFNVDTLHSEINKIINNLSGVDFDIIFLGNTTCNKGNIVMDNIYLIEKNNYLWGTHALLINNKNATKIKNKLCNIYCPIDVQYERLLKNNQLTGFVISPSLCNQNNNLTSIINN